MSGVRRTRVRGERVEMRIVAGMVVVARVWLLLLAVKKGRCLEHEVAAWDGCLCEFVLLK